MASHKTAIHTKNAPSPVGPYSQAIRAGNLIFISGQIPTNPATGELVKGTLKEQTCRCMDNIKAIINAAGGSLKDIVRTTIYLTNMADFSTVNETYSNYFDLNPPTRTTIQVAALPKGVPIEIDAIAYLPSS
ncbi:MAG: RidA family protein [Promethearchaeota archaeon]